MKKIIFTLAIASVALASPALALSGHPKKTETAPAEKTVEQATANVIERVFSEAEKAIIEEYFSVKVSDKNDGHKPKGKKNKNRGLPPGLAKKDQLPPGLAKQLEKNGHLPPGLEKRDLPDDLSERLPARHGLKRLIVGSDVLLVEEGTELILDIIRDAIK